MKKIVIVLISLFFVNVIQAQKKAVTETGEEVNLYDDGSWKYVNEDQLSEKEISTNTINFKKDKESNFLIKSKKLNVGFWLNPKIWSFEKSKDDSPAEYNLSMKGAGLYGMIISEKIEIPLETLKSLAVKNAMDAAPDMKIVKEEYRIVNGIKVLLLQMNGTMQGVKFTYYSYYFSNTNGSVQFVTYTSKKLFESYKPKMESLLNGIVEIN
ncbi:MAG: hypothetical protein NT127_07815 [Sphingobacteriales bacterium]|nr:hypothetical protein [Sphingobacteriales bacterium]